MPAEGAHYNPSLLRVQPLPTPLCTRRHPRGPALPAHRLVRPQSPHKPPAPNTKKTFPAIFIFWERCTTLCTNSGRRRQAPIRTRRRGSTPRQPRHSSSATAQCQHPNTLRYSRALPLAGPVFLAFAFIGHAALTKCPISLVAGERNLLSVPNFLARSACAVASNCPDRYSLPSDTLRPWPRA